MKGRPAQRGSHKLSLPQTRTAKQHTPFIRTAVSLPKPARENNEHRALQQQPHALQYGGVTPVTGAERRNPVMRAP